MSKQNGTSGSPGRRTRRADKAAPQPDTPPAQDLQPGEPPSHRGPGRPSKVTPEVIAAIVQAIRDGAPVDMAANAAGIGASTLYEHRVKNPEISEAIEKARAECAMRRIKRIEAAGKEGTWQADAWYLERQYPGDFALRQRLEHTGKDGERLRVLAWSWEVNGNADRNLDTPHAAPESGNGRPVNGTVPGHRLRTQVGKNGSE